MPAIKKVNTATLVRGSIYVKRHPKSTSTNPIDSIRFERGVPIVIDDRDLLDDLEDDVDVVTDDDGDEVEKPRFLIEYSVTDPRPQRSNRRKRLEPQEQGTGRRRPRRRVRA